MREKSNMKIEGITGIRHLALFDRLDGMNDAGSNQVCRTENGITTPRIIQKCRCCDRFTNELFIQAVDDLSGLYVDAASSVKELFVIRDELDDCDSEVSESASCDVHASKPSSEKDQRYAARSAAEKRAKAARKKELTIHLAELKQLCNNIDETLNHDLDRARSILRSHIEEYWAGILQKAAEADMPVSPFMPEEQLTGRNEYIAQRARIMELLDSALEEGGMEA